MIFKMKLESLIPRSYIKHPFESGNSSAGRAQPCQDNGHISFQN